jgi:hypothetical protein
MDKGKEVIGGDVSAAAMVTQRPPICHHCGLSGHIRPLCSLLNAQRSSSRRSYQDKLYPVLNLCPGIRLHDIRLFSISGNNKDLFLPIRMVNPKETNQGTT